MRSEMQNQQEEEEEEASEDSSTPVSAAETTETTATTTTGVDDDGVAEKKVKSNDSSELEKKHNCVVIDIKCDSNQVMKSKENWDGDKVCRICHLNSDDHDYPSSDETLDLIMLGCGCKDELGVAHRHCAEAWFKLKGNRCCEICGKAAKNVTGVGDNRFMEEWNERSDASSVNTDTRRGLFRGQPFCNFLMACLVIAFIIPWFFRVSFF